MVEAEIPDPSGGTGTDEAGEDPVEEAIFDASIQVLHYAKTNLQRLRNYVGSASQIRTVCNATNPDFFETATRASRSFIFDCPFLYFVF